MNDEYLKKLYGWIKSNDSSYGGKFSYEQFSNKMEDGVYAEKMHGWVKGIDPTFFSLEDFNSKIKKKSQAENGGSTLGVGSSVSPKTDGDYTYGDKESVYRKQGENWLINNESTGGQYVDLKDPTGSRAKELNRNARKMSSFEASEKESAEEIAKTKDLRNVADKGSEIFTGYPGKEKNQYEFSNGNWYELNPEVEKTIKKSKESYVPVGGLPMGGGMFINPSGEGQDFAKPGTSKNSLDAIKNVPKKRVIKNEARIKALNKQFGKNAIAPIPSEAPLKKAQKTEEQDYFTGAFGDVLRGFDNIVPIGIGDFVDDMARSVASGYRQGTVAQEADDLLLKGSKSTPEQIQKFINANKNSQQMLPSAEMQDYQKIYEEEGKGFWGVVKGIVKNPSVIGELMTSSLVSMATNTDALKAGAAGVATGATYGAATGATAGGVGAIPGSVAGAVSSIPYAFGLASSVVEMGATFGELLTEELKGKELTKENVKAILENPEKLQSIRNKAIARGVIIGAADALTGKLASGVGAKIISKSAAKSATGAVTKGAVVKSTAAGAAIEAAGGSAGEATARGAIGQDMDISEIALEGIAELPGGIRSTIQARLAKPSYKVNGAKATSEQVDELINTMTPDELAKTKIEIKNDYEGREFKMQDKIVTNSIKQQVKQGNPELNEPSLNAITQLEKDLVKLEGNTTQTGKDKAAAIRTQIKNIQENQLQEEATAEAITAETPEVTQKRTERIAELETTLSQSKNNKGTITIDDKIIPRTELENELKTLKIEQNAIQKQTAGEVPVQPTTAVGEEVVQGEPTAEPQVLTEEGKAEEVAPLTLEEEFQLLAEEQAKAPKAKIVEAPVEEDNTFVYKINKETTPSGKGKWEDDFEIIDNRDGQSFGEDEAKWVVYNNVSGTSVDALSKKDAQDIIKNAPSYEGLWNEGETINFTELNSKQQENYREEFNRQKAAKAPVVEAEATPQEKVATYRAEEQAELLKAIPKIESYKVKGKIDKTKMPKTVLAKYNKIYEKYDALISPLLEPVVKAPVVKAEAPKAKGELPVMSWSKVEEYDDAVIRSMKEIQYGKLKPLLDLGKRTTVAQKEEIKTIQAKIATAERILDKRANKIKKEAQRVEKEGKGATVRAVDNNGTEAEYSVVVSKDGATAKVQLKKIGTLTPKRASVEANLEIKTDENKKRFVTTKNKTKVYIDEAITPAKAEPTKAKVTTKSNVKAAPVKEKVKKEFIIDGKEYTEEEAIEISQNNSRYPNYESKMEYNGSDPQAKEFVNNYNRDSSPYNRNGDLKGTYIQEKISEALGSMNFRKFGNLYRKHIDPYFSRASNEKSQGGWVDKNLSFRELAGYIIGDASPSYFEEAPFRAFAKEAGIEIPLAPVKEEIKEEAPVVEDNTFVYKMSEEIMPSGKGKWEADFEIIDNRDGKNLGEGAKWAVYNRIGGEMVDALSKQDAADIIKNAPSYGGEMWGEGKTIDFTDLDKKEQDNHREEFNKQKAAKAAPVVEEVKAEPVAEKVKAPAPAKESTDDLMSAINSIKEDIKETTEEIEKARAEAKEKIEKINAENIDLDDLEADIKEIQDDLKKDLDGLKLDLDRHVKALKEEVKKLGDLDAKAPENKKTLLSYLDAAIKTLNGLNSNNLLNVKVDAGFTITKWVAVGVLKKILQGIRLGVIAGNTINASIRAMAIEYRIKHKNKKITIAEFTKEIEEYLRNTFVDQKTNEQDIQETRAKFVEIREAVRKAKVAVKTESKALRANAFDAIQEMLKGKVKKLSAVQMKSIMLRLARFNVFSQIQYDKFIDYVDKVIGIADYDAKVNEANKNRKTAKKNTIGNKPKLGDITPDLFRSLSIMLNIDAKLIPSDVFESYYKIVEMLSKRDAVLKLNKRADLNESLDKIIESIESNEQRISDLKELYDNFAGKTADYAETLDEMLKVGLINQAEHKLMKTFKLKIQGPKVKDKMTEQQIADEKVELIDEINNTTITLDEIVGDEFRLERDLVKRLQDLLKNKKTLERLNNKDLKDLLRVIDNINNGFVSNATQEMVEKLNFIEKSILLESSIPETFKVIIARVNQSLEKRISKRINVAPLFNIDQQLGDFKTKNIFNSIFNESAKAQQGYQSAITLIQDELDKIERGIATSFENEPNKIILSQFKMMVYMMQLEYDSNPTKQEGSKKQVHQAMKTLDETIKFAKQNSEKSGYNELDIAQMESIKKEFEKDGEIDIDKLYNSFNESEKNGLKKLQEINDRMTKFATYTATVINGNKIKPLKNYISYTVINESDILSSSETTDQINNINANMDPGTVSKNLEERDGKVHPVYLNPFYATNSSSRSVLLNYHMTEPVRTARKTLRNAKTLLEEKKGTTKDQYDILNAITGAYNTATKDLLESNFTQSNKILEFLKRQGYRAMLASGTRAAAELSSNVIFVLANNKFDMARGLSKQIINIEEKDKKSIMTNLGATVESRLYPKSSINSAFVELTTNQNRSSKSKNTKTEAENVVIQAWNETAKKYVLMPVAGLADYVISKPDQLVMRPLWFGAFSRAFEKEAGIKPDFDKIMENNEEYMDKYKDALEKATTMADKQVITSGSSTNAYMGILQNVVREGDKVAAWTKEFNRFMNKFTVQEYYTAREGVRALVGNGTISRSDGAHVLAAVTLRMTSYFLFTRLFSEGLAVVARSLGFGGDDDDDDKTAKQKISQGILSSITTLVFGRYFGNFIRVAENALIELVNKEYGEAIGLRDGEYDPYEDAIQFNQLQEGKVDKLTDLFKVMAGPLSPAIGTAELAYKLIISPKPEGERAKLTRAKELYRRLPLEIGGLAGVVPFYKDVRKIVMEGVYKELKKETKETAVKKKAEEIKTALKDSQKTISLKEMMNSGEYTREGIKKELRKIKDPEYRKALKDKDDAIRKKILDKYGYENLTDFKRNDVDNYEIQFGEYSPYRIKREESARIANELKKRLNALKDGEEYYPTDGATIVVPKKKVNKYNRYKSVQNNNLPDFYSKSYKKY